MKLPQYVLLLTLGLICTGLSVASVALSATTIRSREHSALRQAQLNSGILGQQGQQIQAGVLQDLAVVANRNEKLRKLLERHGYNVAAPRGAERASAPSVDATSTKP
jgi:hypothetical protein